MRTGIQVFVQKQLFGALSSAVPSRNFIQGAEHSQQRAFQALLPAQVLFSLQLCARHHGHFLLRSCFMRARRELALIPTPRRKEAAWVRRAYPAHCRGPYKCLLLQPHSSACQREPRAAAMGECRAGEAPCGAPGETEHCPDGDQGHQRTQRAALPCTPSCPPCW